MTFLYSTFILTFPSRVRSLSWYGFPGLHVEEDSDMVPWEGGPQFGNSAIGTEGEQVGCLSGTRHPILYLGASLVSFFFPFPSQAMSLNNFSLPFLSQSCQVLFS